MKEYNIASIPGDGIGKEVVPEGLKVLKEAAQKHQFKINFTEYDFASCDYYKKHGKMLPDDWKEKLEKHDAIFFGAGRYARSSSRPYIFMGIFASV
jgi:tartrate dehydrogenase/decarboxylase/D-malate dehydrogenase